MAYNQTDRFPFLFFKLEDGGPAAKPRNALEDIRAESEAAAKKFKPFNSAHEGWAVLREEVDELWDEVKKNGATRDKAKMRAEAVQVGAMALRFIRDLCDPAMPAGFVGVAVSDSSTLVENHRKRAEEAERKQRDAERIADARQEELVRTRSELDATRAAGKRALETFSLLVIGAPVSTAKAVEALDALERSCVAPKGRKAA